MAISTADRPFYFNNLKAGDGVPGIADFIVSLGGLPDGSNAMESIAIINTSRVTYDPNSTVRRIHFKQ